LFKFLAGGNPPASALRDQNSGKPIMFGEHTQDSAVEKSFPSGLVNPKKT